MSLNESIVEDAALEWFLLRSAPLNLGGQVGDPPTPRLRRTGLGYAVGHGPHLAPGEPAAERESFSEVVLVGRLREAIRRLNPAIPEEADRSVRRSPLRLSHLCGVFRPAAQAFAVHPSQ